MKKTLTLVLSLTLAVAIGIGGTLAYFTDTDTKQNVFTVGNVDITLTEPDWEENSQLIPGQPIAKDPTITVAEGSETAYTFMKVVFSDEFVNLINKVGDKEATFEANTIDVWFAPTADVTVLDSGTNYIVLGAKDSTAAEDYVEYFTQITVPGTVGELVQDASAYTIDVTAYAIQAEGFTTSALAYAQMVDIIFPAT